MEGQFAFARLPYEVQVKLFQRFLYHQWTVFDQCCIYSNSFSKTFSSMRFPLHADLIHFESGKVRIKEEGRPIEACSNLMITANGIFVDDQLDDEMCISIMTLTRKTNLIDIKRSFTCSLELYSLMIKTLGILYMGSHSIGTNVDFTQTDITLDRLLLHTLNSSVLSAKKVMSINAKYLYVYKSSFTSADIVPECVKFLLENDDNVNEIEKWIGGAFSIESIERELVQFKEQPPTLIVWGTGDLFLSKTGAENSVQYCRNAQLKFIEGASHWVMQDEPQLVNKYVEEFLGEGGPSGAVETEEAISRPDSPASSKL